MIASSILSLHFEFAQRGKLQICKIKLNFGRGSIICTSLLVLEIKTCAIFPSG